MKGNKKCFGLLLALSITVGLSLNVSSNVNALRHEYSTTPLFSLCLINSGLSACNQNFSISWLNAYSSDYPDFSKLRKQAVQLPTNFIDNKCNYRYSSSQPQSDGYNFKFNSSYNFADFYSSPSSTSCNTIYPFGSQTDPDLFGYSTIPEFNNASLAGNSLRDLLNHNLPYNFAYNTAFFKDTHITDQGLHYNTTLKLSSFFDSDSPVIVSKFYNLELPYWPIDQSVTGPLTQGRQIEYQGVMQFPGVSYGDGFSWADDFFSENSDSIFSVYYSYLTSNSVLGSSGGGSFPCTLTNRSLENLFQVSFSCSGTIPVDLTDGYFLPYLRIKANTGSYVFDTTSDWSFSLAYVITDNDSTPGQPFIETCSGNDCDFAPGSADLAYNNTLEDPSWFDSLKNLFTFDFINPFAPIFSLFTDNSSCAEIPVLAGMLHSNETEICPWFDSTTRSIVTPVIGLSSMMLLFGVAVKWLKSGSGNLFEDSEDK